MNNENRILNRLAVPHCGAVREIVSKEALRPDWKKNLKEIKETCIRNLEASL